MSNLAFTGSFVAFGSIGALLELQEALIPGVPLPHEV